LYNRVVASYHKAKVEQADMARELAAAKGKTFLFFNCFFFFNFIRLTVSFAHLQLLPPGFRSCRRIFGPPAPNVLKASRRSGLRLPRRRRSMGS
jgi:hypothetical protein